MSEQPMRITEATIDPVWTLGGVDGWSGVYLRVALLTGPLNLLLPVQSARELYAALSRALDDRQPLRPSPRNDAERPPNGGGGTTECSG